MDFFTQDITNEQIKQLPVIQFPGTIYVIDELQKVQPAIERLRQVGLLGFDTETRPSFKRGKSYKISLVQLATEDECFLFRINMIGFPEELKGLLEDENVIKVGFDLSSDFHQIRKIIEFKPTGFIDLQKLAKEMGFKTLSLRKLTAIVFGKRLSKRQRLSNWENIPLTPAQQIYAATDAWVTLMLYKELKAKKEKE